MLGAIFGDIAGSAYEFHNTHDYNFHFITRYSTPTDDSYMTMAVADVLVRKIQDHTIGDVDECRKELVKSMRRIGLQHPDAGYGGMFHRWLYGKVDGPYNSFGNGSGMRAAAVGWLFDTLEETLAYAKISAEVTHNHPEGIKGAQAVAACIFLARNNYSKQEIQKYVEETFHYDLHRSLDQIRKHYHFDETCQGSVPEAILAFLEGEDYEDVIRKAVILGGDSDTIACMAGGIAEAYYGLPQEYADIALSYLDEELLGIVKRFEKVRK